MKLLSVVAAPAFVLIFSGCASADSKNVATYSVCDLADSPVSADIVILKSVYVTDGFHEPMLVDSRCPGKRLLPSLPKNPGSEFDAITSLQPNVISGPYVAVFDIEVEGFLTKFGSSPVTGFQIVTLKSLSRRQSD